MRRNRPGDSPRAAAMASAVDRLVLSAGAVDALSLSTVLGLRGFVSQTILAHSTGRSLDNSYGRWPLSNS